MTTRTGDSDSIPPLCPPGSKELWRAGRNPEAMCDCDGCSDEGVQCDATLDFGANGFCEASVSGTGCQPIDSMLVGQFWVAFEISTTPGSACTLPMPGEPEFTSRTVACEPMGESCDGGGLCVEGPACIWQDGDQECPPPFMDKTVVFDDFEAQDLSCDVCACGQGAFFCEEATLTPYAEPACGGEPVASSVDYSPTSCGSYADPDNFVLIDEIASIDIQPIPPDCSSPLGAPVAADGSLTPMGPRTLCCTP